RPGSHPRRVRGRVQRPGVVRRERGAVDLAVRRRLEPVAQRSSQVAAPPRAAGRDRRAARGQPRACQRRRGDRRAAAPARRRAGRAARSAARGLRAAGDRGAAPARGGDARRGLRVDHLQARPQGRAAGPRRLAARVHQHRGAPTMSYEQALTAARLAPVTLPPFEAIAHAADRDREARQREDQLDHARARRWLWVSAALWLLLPLDAFVPVVLGLPGASWAAVAGTALDVAVMVLPPALVSIWGARLTRDRRFRSAILSRAIAASNLAVALIYAASVGGVFGAVFASLLALASARCLAL